MWFTTTNNNNNSKNIGDDDLGWHMMWCDSAPLVTLASLLWNQLQDAHKAQNNNAQGTKKTQCALLFCFCGMWCKQLRCVVFIAHNTTQQLLAPNATVIHKTQNNTSHNIACRQLICFLHRISLHSSLPWTQQHCTAVGKHTVQSYKQKFLVQFNTLIASRN